MDFAAQELPPLEFEIGPPGGTVTYTVPPLGFDDGQKLAEILTELAEATNAAIAAAGEDGLKPGDLPESPDLEVFELCAGPVWQQMKKDRVPRQAMFRVGLSCLARERILLYDMTPGAWDRGTEAAMRVWESGLPEASAAALTAAASPTPNRTTRRATQRAAATTTRTPSSGNGTRTAAKAKKKPASRSRGATGASSGRSSSRTSRPSTG